MLPTVLVIGVFQLLVFQKLLNNVTELLAGLTLVNVGLSLLIVGLEMRLFPLGEGMAYDFARKGSLPWLMTFAFALGAGTTYAEPALIAIADRAAKLRAQGFAAEEQAVAAADSADLCQSVMASFLLRLAAGQFELANEVDMRRLLATMAQKKFLMFRR